METCQEETDRTLSAQVRKRSITLAGHKTSLSLEEAFWVALKAEAERRKLSLNALVEEIDRSRQGNLSSAVRVFLLQQLQERAHSPD